MFPPGVLVIIIRRRGHYPTLIALIDEDKREAVVVAQSLMSNLIAQYGPVEGANVYFKMERERKGPFQDGAKYGEERLGSANPVANVSPEQLIVEAFRVRMAKATKARKRH